jgi:3-hydroxyisobutyrate dehydrogenase-like beta-hydroxyacid dehydrogenase
MPSIPVHGPCVEKLLAFFPFSRQPACMRIAILGLGIIGGTWARNFIEDGLNVRCWNRTPKDFPCFCSTAAEAAQGADFIFLVLADPPAVESVLGQILGQLGPGQMVIQSSTISAKWSRHFAGQMEATGAMFLEAPFTGSKPAAEQRKTVFYLGGSEQTIEKACEVLGRLASATMHVGPVGSASSLKLAMNLNIAGVAQALCESLTLARAEGIPDQIYFEALDLNVARSGVSDLKQPKLRSEDFSPQFSVKHMAKDLRLALETAEADSLALELTRKVLDSYERGIQAGWAEDDYIGLVRLLKTPRG